MKTDTYDPAMKPVKTMYRGELYDSGLEARFAGACYLLGIDYHHNDLAWMDDDGSVPQYKPDFTWTASTGEIVVVEVKGRYDVRSLAQRESMKARVDDPDDEVIALISTTRDEMMIYQSGEELPAAFYRCPSCGKGYISQKARHQCPRCGEEDVCFVAVDFNSWYNDQAKLNQKKDMKDFADQVKQHKKERLETKEQTARLAKRLKELAADEGMALENTVGILSPYARGEAGEIRPDYNYDEAKKNRDYFGTAYAPFAVVYISAQPSDLEKRHYEEVKSYVADRMSPLVKSVLVDAEGIHVCDDKQNTPRYEDGAIFTCDKCGATYFARLNAHECPCCGSYKPHKVSK